MKELIIDNMEMAIYISTNVLGFAALLLFL